ATGTKFAEIFWMTSSFDRGPDRCPKPVPQHSSRGSPKTVHKNNGRCSSLASLRPSATSVSQGICCHGSALADGLMTAASWVNSAALGEGCLASAGAWARTSRAGPYSPRANASNSTPIVAGGLILTSVQPYDSPGSRPLHGGT